MSDEAPHSDATKRWKWTCRVERPASKVMLRAEAVWDRLNRLNMTQNELADLLEISSGHLSRLVNGRRCPSPSMRRRFMEVSRLLRVRRPLPRSDLQWVDSATCSRTCLYQVSLSCLMTSRTDSPH